MCLTYQCSTVLVKLRSTSIPKNTIYSAQRLVTLIEFHFFTQNETINSIQLARCSPTQKKVAMSRPEIFLFFPPFATEVRKFVQCILNHEFYQYC